MYVYISGFVMSIRMSAYKSLTTGKKFICNFHTDSLYFFEGEAKFFIFRIKAYYVMVEFNLAFFLIFMILRIPVFTFFLKSGRRLNTYCINHVFIPEYHMFVFIQDRLIRFFIILVCEIS